MAEQTYGGFWIRFLAYMTDSVILVIASCVIVAAAVFTGAVDVSVASLIVSVGSLLYFVLMQASARRATFGKSLVGLKVTDTAGEQISFLRSLGRELCKIISALILMIGFLLAAFTSRKQALHDMVASTYVVRDSPGHVVAALALTVVALLAPFLVVIFLGAGAVAMMAGMAGAMMGGAMDQAMKDAQNPPAQSAMPVQVAPAQKPAPLPTVAKAPSSAPAPAASEPPKPVIVEPPKPAVVAIPKPAPVEIPKEAPARVAAAKPEPAPSPAPDEKPRAAAPAPARAAALPPVSETRPGIPGPKYNDLMTAVLYRDAAAVNELIAFGRWADRPDSQGVTPLMAAAMLGDTTNAETLLKAGANPDAAMPIARKRSDGAMTALLERYATSKRP